MSMYTALSGVSASQAEISAISHNISNVGTYGFKGSRVEFADIFSSSPMSVGRTATGSGVQTARVVQIFEQGNVTATGNVLDLAIEGVGFFPVQSSVGQTAETLYTRAGAFGLDSEGRIVNSKGAQLMGWPTAKDGRPLSATLDEAIPLTIPPAMGEIRATRSISAQLNLPFDDANIGQQAAIPPAAFSPDDPTTYAFKTPIVATDDTGAAINAWMYTAKSGGPGAVDQTATWDTHLVIDGFEVNPVGSNQTTFDSFGALQSGDEIVFDVSGNNVTVNLSGSKLAQGNFEVETLSHDGLRKSSLYSVAVDADGTVWAGYSSGESIAMGKIFLATFANPQGMRQMGATALSQTQYSGQPMLGVPGDSGFGLLRSGSLERSNVDLTEELVNLITAQRNYQASAKAMETSSSLSQTIINMRG